MRIVLNQYPPLIDEIDAAFKVKGKQVFFCWGDKIYNPSGCEVAPYIIAHETIHRVQQNPYEYNEEMIITWWRRYIHEPEFRLSQEIPAHVAEYRHKLERQGINREIRRQISNCHSGGITALLAECKLISPREAVIMNNTKNKFPQAECSRRGRYRQGDCWRQSHNNAAREANIQSHRWWMWVTRRYRYVNSEHPRGR